MPRISAITKWTELLCRIAFPSAGSAEMTLVKMISETPLPMPLLA